MGYWAGVRRQAARETLALVRLDEPGRALVTALGIGIPALAGLAASATLEPIARALAALGAVALAGLLIFGWKLISIPPQLDAARAKEIASLEASQASKEARRRDALIYQLTSLWQMKHWKEVSYEMQAGLELPPEDWLNERLAEMGEHWSVFGIRGASYQTFEILGPAPPRVSPAPASALAEGPSPPS